ncbi:MAG: hypothetical protein ACRCT1_14870 [Microcoleaceae cyanobacterium]
MYGNLPYCGNGKIGSIANSCNNFHRRRKEGRRKKEEGRRKREEGRGKKEE